jgi:ketosteroid isomerase-like protein
MSEKMLPQAVEGFIDAMNRFDLDGLLATFASDAIVNDHRCEFRGRDAIREWLAKEIVGDRVTMKPIEAMRRGEGATVSAVMDGTYDKTRLPSPLVLSFYFSVHGDQIVQLVIVHNKSQTITEAASAGTAAEAHKATVRRFFELFSAGQVSAATALFHDDATYWFPTTRKTLTMAELGEGLTWIRSRLDGPMVFELGRMVADGSAVAVQLESFAKTVEGKPFNNLYHVYFEFEGDRVRRAREYNDTAHVWATLRAGQRHVEE